MDQEFYFKVRYEDPKKPKAPAEFQGLGNAQVENEIVALDIKTAVAKIKKLYPGALHITLYTSVYSGLPGRRRNRRRR